MAMVRIQEATPLPGYRLRLVLTDGRTLERDLQDILRGELFDPLLRDPALFASVTVREGAVTWSNGADLCPDVLIWNGPPPEHDLPFVPIAQRTMMQDLWRRHRPDQRVANPYDPGVGGGARSDDRQTVQPDDCLAARLRDHRTRQGDPPRALRPDLRQRGHGASGPRAAGT